MTNLEKRLKEIKTRCEAATPGPWAQYKNGPGVFINSGEENMSAVGYAQIVATGNMGETTDCKADARLIAHARQDLPMLLEMLDFTFSLFKELADGIDPENELVDECKKHLNKILEAHGE